MTEREIAERVLALSHAADQLCLPGHRITADRVYGRQDELRNGIRRLYRDLTGVYPEHGPGPAASEARPAARRPEQPLRVWRSGEVG